MKRSESRVGDARTLSAEEGRRAPFGSADAQVQISRRVAGWGPAHLPFCFWLPGVFRVLVKDLDFLVSRACSHYSSAQIHSLNRQTYIARRRSRTPHLRVSSCEL